MESGTKGQIRRGCENGFIERFYERVKALLLPYTVGVINALYKKFVGQWMDW